MVSQWMVVSARDGYRDGGQCASGVVVAHGHSVGLNGAVAHGRSPTSACEAMPSYS